MATYTLKKRLRTGDQNYVAGDSIELTDAKAANLAEKGYIDLDNQVVTKRERMAKRRSRNKAASKREAVSPESTGDTTEAPDENQEAPEQIQEAPDENQEAPEQIPEAPEETTEAPEPKPEPTKRKRPAINADSV